MPVGTTDRLKAWARGKLEEADATVLTRVLNASTKYVARRIGRKLTRASRTIVFDGDRAEGRQQQTLRIPIKHSPIDVSTIVVTEDGSALVRGVGFDQAADYIVDGAGDEERATRLIRRPSAPLNALKDSTALHFTSWRPGIQNITAVFTGGWDEDSEAVTDPIPHELEQVVYEIAWLFFSQPGRLGKAATTKGAGSGTTFDKQLSPAAVAILAMWTGR